MSIFSRSSGQNSHQLPSPPRPPRYPPFFLLLNVLLYVNPKVLHRQLEAKDRDRARREREYQEATARARVEARSAQERVGLLRKEAEDALSAKGAAEAMAEAASNSLERQTAAVEV